MAETYKVLGQVAPASASAVSLYTVPSSTQTVISTITICNRGNVDGTYRTSIRPSGAAEAAQHYIAYDSICLANSTVALTLGITLGATDIITVYASSASFTFGAFGAELT